MKKRNILIERGLKIVDTKQFIKEREMDIETKAKVVADYVSSDWTMEMVRDELAWLYKTLILDHDNADVSDFINEEYKFLKENGE